MLLKSSLTSVTSVTMLVFIGAVDGDGCVTDVTDDCMKVGLRRIFYYFLVLVPTFYPFSTIDTITK